MAKIDLDDVASGYNRQRINTNFQSLEDELNTKVLYRDNPTGEPNQMENDIDMNSNDITNAGTINTDALFLEGKAVVDPALIDESVVLTIDSIATLPAVTIGHKVSVTGYHADTAVGGGDFVGGTGVHNGGTIIDPNRTFPTPVEWANGSTDPAVVAWFDNSGGTVSCWVSTDELAALSKFGGIRSTSVPSAAAIEAQIKSRTGVVNLSTGKFKIDKTIDVPYDITMLGTGRYDSAENTTQLRVDGVPAFNLLPDAANVTLENFAMSGHNTNNSAGITTTGSNYFNVTLRQVNFFQFSEQPVYFNNVDQLRMDSCWFNQNKKPANFSTSDGLVTNTLFEGRSSDLSDAPEALVYVGASDGTPEKGGLKFLDIQFERSRIGLVSKSRLEINGLNYSNVLCPVYLESGTAILNDFRPVNQGNEVIAMLVGDCSSYQFTRVPLVGGGGYTRNIKPKQLKNISTQKYPSTWARVDNFTPVSFLTANNAGFFESDDYVWLQNGGSFAPGGSSSPKIVQTLPASSLVFELISSGTGYMNVGTGGSLINCTQSDGFAVDRKCAQSGGGGTTIYAGSAALGGAYAEFNIYENLYQNGSFDDSLNDALTVLSGTPGYTTSHKRGGFGQSLSVTAGEAYLSIPDAAKSKTVELGTYVYIPAGVSLTVSTYSTYSPFNDRDLITISGDDKWHLFRLPTMPGTQTFFATLKFKFDGVVYFDDAACIEMTTD